MSPSDALLPTGLSETTLALLVALGLAVIIPLAVLAINALLSRHNPTAFKDTVYEAGLSQTQGTARGRFAIKFYLIAILFVIFDVEAVFMYPWAVNFRDLGTAGFTTMLVFLGVLLVGYVYLVKRGALEWE